MTTKLKDFMNFLNIKEEDYDPSKERLLLMFEESDDNEEFIVQVFDISVNENKTSLIKELGYGILSSLYNEDFIESIRESGRYAFNVKHPQTLEEDKVSYADNIITFKKPS